MLGKGGMYADTCKNEGFIGADYGIKEDLSSNLQESWRDFNKEYIPVFLKENPAKSRVAAGLACGMLWTVCRGLQVGDVVICPNGTGEYYVGTIKGGYYYTENEVLPHRRRVDWLGRTISRNDMSINLKNSTGSIGTCCDISRYSQELESLMTVNTNIISCENPDIEDLTEFALEKHLEEFLVKNWKNTPLGKKYDVYEDNGELVGQQYPSDTGPIDILAISKDKKTLLVIELKKGRASDTVVGQIQRYMGYVKEELAESTQAVKGVIIGLSADTRLKRALSVTTNIEFYRYQIDFKLTK